MRYGLLWWAAAACCAAADDGGWPAYGRDGGGTKFSPLTQITRENVGRLQVAWTVRLGDLYDPQGKGRRSALETTPLFVNGKLYATTPFGRVTALDPVTGRQLWSTPGNADEKAGYGDFANRGAAYWRDGNSGKGACRQRIFIATIDARLLALDADNGRACEDFGVKGAVDLRTGLHNPPRSRSEYEETSPPAIIDDLVVVGSAVADNGHVRVASGEVRAFDARSGKLRWTWDPIPRQPGDKGAETWKGEEARQTGGANAWSIISVDPARHLVFVPTGSASPDYYGGERKGGNLFANSVVALDARTGKIVWHFQTVHHDLWDYDVASQPTLFEWRRDGRVTPAIAVGSKTGHLFFLNRETGVPLFPVEERRVPASDVAGEEAALSQPFPLKPAGLGPQGLRSEDAWGPTPEDREWCAGQIAKLRSEGIFTPPSVQGSLLFPGNVGGMAWGGAALDAIGGQLIVPTNRLAAVVRLIPRAEYDELRKRRESGTDRLPRAEADWEYAPQSGTPYGMARRFLLSPKMLPCNAPPWSALTAIDVNTGEPRWEVPLGTLPWAAGQAGAEKWGSISLGGPIVTAGRLVFIGSTLDPYLRAFDAETGRELWKAKLPTSARATPMTYAINGKQYVVIAAGGHDAPGNAHGDHLVAFSLP